MGISSAVDWWEEWQLRILVLGSLFVQYILFFSAPYRKFAIPSWYRSIIWLSYVGSDALAIYALATLFSREKKRDYSSAQDNSILEVVWAPVLLMHLGGQDCITAYKIEDNELWKRHVLTAVSQITVAIYVFCKSWPGGDKRLLQAAILLFTPGILKCIEKPWALKGASFNSLVSLSDSNLHPGMLSSQRWIGLFPGKASREAGNAARHPGMGTDPIPRTGSNTSHGLMWHLIGRLLPGMGSKAARSWRMVSRRRQAISVEDYVQKARAFLLADYDCKARREGNTTDLEQNHVPQAQREASQVDLEGNHHRQAQGKDVADLETDHVPRAQGEGDEVSQQNRNSKKKGLKLEAHKLFADLASSYPDRLIVLKSFLVYGDDQEAYDSLQKELFDTFDHLYTKWKFAVMLAETDPEELQPSPRRYVTFYVRGAAAYLPFVATGLFHKSHREAYNVHDVKVTYALLCCTAALEFFSASIRSQEFQLSGAVAQYSLVGFFASNKKHTKKMCSSSSRITMLVLGHVKGWWMEHITDVASYWRFNDHRGQWTIQHKGCDQELEWGLNRPFDESVLLWHIATDLCFYQEGNTSVSHAKATACREISNYMIYLLFVTPEMLLSGTRRDLFMEATAELEEILMHDKPLLKKILKGDTPSLMEIIKGNKSFLEFLKGKGPSSDEIERGFMHRIIANLQATECRCEDLGYTELPMEAEQCPSAQEGFIQDAWKISKALLALGDEKMWEVIEGVWVEMLCFSASRCRGYLHAKSMGSGMELLTYVWFLLSRMGMETLPERLQRTERSSRGGNTGAPPATSQIHQASDSMRFRRSMSH